MVFAVGLTPPENKKLLDNVAQGNLSPAMRKKAGFFYLVGSTDYDKLGPFHKLFMKSTGPRAGAIKQGKPGSH